MSSHIPGSTQRFWEYWAHGVSAIVEFPNLPFETRRNTFGLTLRQRENTENWVHLALPTPVVADNKKVFLMYALLKGATNENARVDYLKVADDKGSLFERSVSFTDETFDERIRVIPVGQPAPLLRSGITFSMRVKFLSGVPIGAVILGSAGTRLVLSITAAPATE